MRIILEQSFPLGRFHANPWRSFVFDDPYGEWPPSPWRLIRAIIARSYQFSREISVEKESIHDQLREQLVRSFCASKISWKLPTQSWRGPGILQYQPSEFKFSHPKPKKLNVYQIDDDFHDVVSDINSLHLYKEAFFTMYKDINKKDVIELFSEDMELVKRESDLEPKITQVINKHIKNKKMKPKKYKRYFPDSKNYNTTKVKDNFWLTQVSSTPLFWILEGDNSNWTDKLLVHLDACLARMTYFGRAESITLIERVQNQNSKIVSNCVLRDSRTSVAVPVLCPFSEATLAQVCGTTSDDIVANSTTPPGAVWKYAERPAITRVYKRPKSAKKLPPTSELQFAIGGRVFPNLKSWIRITEKFRGILLRKIAQKRTKNRKAKFEDLPSNIRAEYSLLTGKDENSAQLRGHRHVAFFLIPDERGNPSRLICYRKEPFTSEEQTYFLVASEASLAWDFNYSDWRLRLVPLPKETPLPPSKNIFGESRVWETLVPYVPPLHVLRRNGKPKPGAEIETQIKSHLEKLGLPTAKVTVLNSQNTPIQWIKVHRPRRSRNGQTNDDKRSYRIRLIFSEPVNGPIFLGDSSHFGLGLFAAIRDGSHPSISNFRSQI